MKNIQKLEFYAGMATLATALLHFFVTLVPSSNEVHNAPREIYLLWCFIFYVVPEVFVAVGSYLHGIKQSKFGFGLVIFFAGLLSILYGGLIVTGIAFFSANSKGFGALFIGLLPGLCAAVTLCYALIRELIFNE